MEQKDLSANNPILDPVRTIRTPEEQIAQLNRDYQELDELLDQAIAPLPISNLLHLPSEVKRLVEMENRLIAAYKQTWGKFLASGEVPYKHQHELIASIIGAAPRSVKE